MRRIVGTAEVVSTLPSDKLFQDGSDSFLSRFGVFFPSPNETPKKRKKYFNFIHFLSAKFNFFDASRYFSNCPREG